MEIAIAPPSRLEGEITPPGDKSISHRAAIFNAIAQGNATIRSYSPGADCSSTLRCLRSLGVGITEDSQHATVRVEGAGAAGLREPANVLNAGNSGTTMRLLAGVLAGQPFFSVITGDSSLRGRPMGRIVKPLQQMGAQISGRGQGSLAPLAIRGGNLHGISYKLPVASAQVKSALLLAGLFAEGESEIQEPVATRDHTERMLQAMGAQIAAHGVVVRVQRSTLRATDVTIPGDISAAAFWLVAGALHPCARIRLKHTGVNPTRTGVLDVLRQMGARITVENSRYEGGEPVADITVESSSLAGTEIGGDIIPRLIDEIPVIAVAACMAKGTTVIKDAQELRAKESDRIRTTVQELRCFGAVLEERPDGMVIHGTGSLKGARCSSRGDHRLAMSLAVAALVARGKSVVQGAQAASISYPTFWEDLRAVSGLSGEAVA
ncbi:MAG: 3-phosphoshikimate 1-carboxyvinyltransferase [Chloroflexi bacterium]|nr:3-phosphoshikimate 1-carboxyvinyltransferase [Chloroflexota bacterium]